MRMTDREYRRIAGGVAALQAGDTYKSCLKRRMPEFEIFMDHVKLFDHCESLQKEIDELKHAIFSGSPADHAGDGPA